jgi:hypothetical protein
MRGTQVNYNTTLTTEECISCGVMFAIPVSLQARLKDTHRNFYCPNGHDQHYVGKTEEEKLREKLETEQRNVEFWRKQKQNEEQRAARAEHQRDAYKGHTTRLKKRVAKGKCPCCSNTFVNLSAHMAKRHPDFGADNSDGQSDDR